jgi:hypothetical protein
MPVRLRPRINPDKGGKTELKSDRLGTTACVLLLKKLIDMDYEKKYEEALERARAYYEFYKENPAKAQPFIDIFPELVESEDERIRKVLLNLVSNDKANGYTRFYEEGGITCDDAIAYLEKQKEKSEKPIFPESEDERVIKAITHILYENYTDAAVIEGVEIAEIVTWLEKQKEQKPAVYKIPDEILEEMATAKAAKIEGIIEGRQDVINNPEKYGLQKPAEWTDDEKDKLNRIYRLIGIAADEHAYSTTCRLIGDKEQVELQDFLRSLVKPQAAPAEWSEEDEEDEV